jgi:hypothetical protein
MALVAGTIWWSKASQVDPRLVGSWMVSDDTARLRTWVLKSTGTLQMIDERRREELVSPWRVDGDTVIFGQGPLWASDLLENANLFFRRVLRLNPFLPPIAFKVISATDETVVLRHFGGTQLTLTRIPAVTAIQAPMRDRTRVLLAVAIASVTAVFLLWNSRRRRKRENRMRSELSLGSVPAAS